MDKVLVGIDVGTTKVCTLVAEVEDNGRLRVVGVGQAPAQGMRKGMVVNVEEAAAAIQSSLEHAERVSGYHIERAFVGVTGEHVSSLNSRGVVAITHPDRVVRQEDIDRAIEAAQAIAIPHNRKIIHSIPRSFVLDGQDGVRNPIGMQAFRLEVEVHIVIGAVTALQNLINCVQRAGVEIQELVLEPLASAEAVLSRAEREMGVVLADIGGGTTDIAIFMDSAICHCGVLPVGGNQLTNDVAVVFRMPFTVAEQLKIQHGTALPSSMVQDEAVEAPAFGDGTPTIVSRKHLASVLEARAAEVLTLLETQIQKAGYEGMIPAGLVLTGGSAGLEGLKDLGRAVLQVPVRIGVPNGVGGLTDIISTPSHATAVGLLHWAVKYGRELDERPKVKRPGDANNVLSRFFAWVRESFFPR